MSIGPERLANPTLSALVAASAAINNSLDLQATLQTVAETAREVMSAEASSVLLYDRTRQKLMFKAATGNRADLLMGEEFDASVGIAGRVLRTGQAALVEDVREDSSFFKGIDDKSHFTTREIVAAPLMHKGQAIGVVEVINHTGDQHFTGEDVELLRIFANLAASGASNAQAHEQLKLEYRGLRTAMDARLTIVGESAALKHVLDLCARVSGSNATVLLLGETGTGKELLSRHIHAHSPRGEKPFVAINCAALPETLLESELFGHEKGSFTGAVAQKIGRFELANGGTLFLDEIGDISHSTQIKLLRVLQEREFVRVGGTKTVACDVRIIAATNRDLQKGMREGSFRQDLYYRLNVFPIRSPALRERREDIPLLVEHFVKISAVQLGVATPGVSAEATALLTCYGWPGNIRELQNVVERAVLLSDGGTIGPAQLPREIAGEAHLGEGESDKPESGLWDYEKALIVKALKDSGWNQTKAAKTLGISRDNLRYRIKKYEIERPE